MTETNVEHNQPGTDTTSTETVMTETVPTSTPAPQPPKTPTPRKNRLLIIIGSIAASLAVLALVLVLVLGGKDDDDDDSPSRKDPSPTEAVTLAPTETPTPTATLTPTATPTPTDAPLTAIGKKNPLQLSDYEYHPEGLALNDAGDVLLMATLGSEAKVGNLYLHYLDLLHCDDEKILYYYTLRKTPPSTDYSFAFDTLMDEEYTLFLSRINGTDLTDDTVLFDYDNVSIRPTTNGIIITQYSDTGHRISLLDDTFQELRSFSFDEYCYEPQFSVDDKRGYYIRDEAITELHAFDETGSDRVITVKNYRVDALNGVITDSQGTDYLLLTATAGNQESYDIVVNAENSEVLYIAEAYSSIVHEQGNAYVEIMYDDYTFMNTRWITSKDGYTIDFRNDDANLSINSYMLDNGDMLFEYSASDYSELFLYDSETGVLKDSVRLTLDTEMTSSDEFGVPSIYLLSWEMMGDDRLLLNYSDDSRTNYYCVWNIDNTPTIESPITATEYEMGSRPSLEVEHTIDINDFTPGELSPELLPLKQWADVLGGVYGISIYIGEECANIIGGYTVAPLTDYASVEAALIVLQTELTKYPTDFFEQMLPDYLNENAIYLADDLIYIGDDLRGSAAGGFRTDHNGQQLLVLDCVGTGLTIEATLHHELSHVIDDFVLRTCAEEGLSYFTEEGWLALNPPQDIYGDLYSYTYSKYGTTEFLYANAHLLGEDVSNSYFVDGYSTTYPTEDRARIWENVMCDESALDFSAAPHLEAKLNYYIAAIHEAFDTSLWPEELYWEQYE